MSGFDLGGCLRRIRRLADLSQRELAERTGMSKTAVAAAEAGTRDLPVARLVGAAGVAGLRLALLDAEGREVVGMTPDGARDAGYRRLPAHLDTFHSDEVAWRWEVWPHRRRPWFTFVLDREGRDRARAARGTPDDHHVPVPGDSPEERAEARRAARWRRYREELERRFLAGEPAGLDDPFTCECPPGCDGLDDWSGRPVHIDGCPCRCDMG